MKIVLVGERSDAIPAHRGITLALGLAEQHLGIPIDSDWRRTDEMGDPTASLAEVDGIWLVPGSPYADFDAALNVARFARITGVPFLGTCGGFQHALIEFARHVAGLSAAEHEETVPNARVLLVSRLSCSLVEQSALVVPRPGSQFAALTGLEPFRAGYCCNFGFNTAYRGVLEKAGLVFGAEDEAGAPRAFELPGHPFYMGTLFQPERQALAGELSPVIAGFISAVQAGMDL
ncbi:MAG TPA: hypothetical protein VMF06_16340 [Candidatus Limnocylindria bacterium]|jgi:CTP synthase (UTP-ammonia lyase)|nr:hypothetical protein [Candidatus Limnocylindria bacterium]